MCTYVCTIEGSWGGIVIITSIIIIIIINPLAHAKLPPVL